MIKIETEGGGERVRGRRACVKWREEEEEEDEEGMGKEISNNA